MTTAAAILAAGEGSRFDTSSSKLRATLRGRPLVSWAIDHAAEGGFDELFVVTGEDDLGDLLPPAVEAIVNPAWRQGIATSVAAVIDRCRDAGHDAVVVGLGDQPFIEPRTWRSLRDATDAAIVVATYDGVRGNPVRLDRSVWDLVPRTGDRGARRLMAERPDLVAELACAGDPIDIDTQEDLARWS
jgi:CTP:molybdopterin cytidylyltransferase MocA